MFPESLNFDQSIEEVEQLDDWLYNETSYKYDFDKNDFIYEDGSPVLVRGKEAIKVWIEKALRTRIYSYNMYDETDDEGFLEGREYGSHIWSVIRGRRIPALLLEAETKRDVEETLAKNDKIKRITNYDISRSELNSSELVISFTVVLVNDDEVEMEVGL